MGFDFSDYYKETRALMKRYGRPRLGRWVYCKYCYRNVKPELSVLDDLIKCGNCGAGLAPLRNVIEAGSYKHWYEGIVEQFYRHIEKEGGRHESTSRESEP